VFVPKHSGENYHPHVTTGLAPREYLDKMLKAPFRAFTSPRLERPFTTSATSARQAEEAPSSST